MKKYVEIESFLKSLTPPDRLAIVGMGNPDRADDGFGIELALRLKRLLPNQVFSEKERSVEGIVMDLIDRDVIDTILFLDATDFGGRPGDVHIFSADDAKRFVPAFTTHKVPITLIMDLVLQHGKKPYLLGLQPKSLAFFEAISQIVTDVIIALEDILSHFLKGHWKN